MIGLIVAGLIIGAVARLINPGRQRLSLLMTLLLGTGGIVERNAIGFVAAVIAAALLIGVAEDASGRYATR